MIQTSTTPVEAELRSERRWRCHSAAQLTPCMPLTRDQPGLLRRPCLCAVSRGPEARTSQPLPEPGQRSVHQITCCPQRLWQGDKAQNESKERAPEGQVTDHLRGIGVVTLWSPGVLLVTHPPTHPREEGHHPSVPATSTHGKPGRSGSAQ